jgi:putative colanic acid biosynthesis acetyltransferase WcaF
MSSVDLSRYRKQPRVGWGGRLRATLWFFLGLPLLRSPFNPSSTLKCALLRLFGARVGSGVVIKPGVRVKNPQLLSIGSHTWIGEDCWIDNLTDVYLGSHVCISQKAYLCTGNHDWSDPNFGLLISPISVDDGAWVGAGSMIAPGVRIRSHAIATAGSVVTRDIPAWEIHSGNPARFARSRQIREPVEVACRNLAVLLTGCFFLQNLGSAPIRLTVDRTMSFIETAQVKPARLDLSSPAGCTRQNSEVLWRTL